VNSASSEHDASRSSLSAKEVALTNATKQVTKSALAKSKAESDLVKA
jgi:hypothetical protein